MVNLTFYRLDNFLSKPIPIITYNKWPFPISGKFLCGGDSLIKEVSLGNNATVHSQYLHSVASRSVYFQFSSLRLKCLRVINLHTDYYLLRLTNVSLKPDDLRVHWYHLFVSII